MKPILEVQGIGKRYSIRHQAGGYLSLRERMQDAFRAGRSSREDFWALKDVSFEVMPGESVGIIGRNGAGKSTLLKILSRITPPTTGRFVARGRIASLLEVGTGFHPELTGRENVFLNGSLLGMKRREIESKFDEIVDFSGVEKFLDTPLKHYSSGMQLRLAFAVAAFLEPEILVVDEVLAVGDAEFQKKCLGKMTEIGKQGRTVLFVSHNMAAVNLLCANSVLFSGGRLFAKGTSNAVITKYLREAYSSSEYRRASAVKEIGVLRSRTVDNSGQNKSTFLHNESINIVVEVQNSSGIENVSIGIAVCDQWGTKLFTTVKAFRNYPKLATHRIGLPSGVFAESQFTVDVAVFIPNGVVYDYVRGELSFDIKDYERDLSVNAGDTGIFNVVCKWE